MNRLLNYVQFTYEVYLGVPSIGKSMDKVPVWVDIEKITYFHPTEGDKTILCLGENMLEVTESVDKVVKILAGE